MGEKIRARMCNEKTGEFEEVWVPASELQWAEEKTYEPLIQAIIATDQNPSLIERYRIPVSEINVDPAFAPRRDLVESMRGATDEYITLNRSGRYLIDLLEREDGSLWSYDHAVIIASIKLKDPSTELYVQVLGFDPAPGSVRLKWQRKQ